MLHANLLTLKERYADRYQVNIQYATLKINDFDPEPARYVTEIQIIDRHDNAYFGITPKRPQSFLRHDTYETNMGSEQLSQFIAKLPKDVGVLAEHIRGITKSFEQPQVPAKARRV